MANAVSCSGAASCFVLGASSQLDAAISTSDNIFLKDVEFKNVSLESNDIEVKTMLAHTLSIEALNGLLDSLTISVTSSFLNGVYSILKSSLAQTTITASRAEIFQTDLSSGDITNSYITAVTPSGSGTLSLSASFVEMFGGSSWTINADGNSVVHVDSGNSYTISSSTVSLTRCSSSIIDSVSGVLVGGSVSSSDNSSLIVVDSSLQDITSANMIFVGDNAIDIQDSKAIIIGGTGNFTGQALSIGDSLTFDGETISIGDSILNSGPGIVVGEIPSSDVFLQIDKAANEINAKAGDAIAIVDDTHVLVGSTSSYIEVDETTAHFYSDGFSVLDWNPPSKIPRIYDGIPFTL